MLKTALRVGHSSSWQEGSDSYGWSATSENEISRPWVGEGEIGMAEAEEGVQD